MRLVSLGDSFSCGQGVGLHLDLDRTWVGLLSAGLHPPGQASPGQTTPGQASPGPAVQWSPLAVAGARVRDVRICQLPAALALAPQLATVLVGLNDVVRAGFVAADVARDLTAVVTALRDRGCVVLLVRLHDPSALLPLPPLRRALATRVAVLCDTVDALAADPGVHVLDLGAVPRLRDRACWAVDRVHPSAAGHRAMAVAAAAVLGRAGLSVRLPADTTPDRAPGAAAQVRWLAAHGLPWTATHLREVALPLLGMAAGVTPRQQAWAGWAGRAPTLARRATAPSPHARRPPGTAYG